jgi:hypothetical protein
MQFLFDKKVPEHNVVAASMMAVLMPVFLALAKHFDD